MLTRPKNIVVHPVEGTLGLKTINSPFPGDSSWDGIPLVRFRARVPFSVWIHCDALNWETRAPDIGVSTHLPRDRHSSSPVFPG